MKILFIGNSFSVDVSTYMHEIAKAAGKELEVYVLYIGGCSVENHWKRYLANDKAYEFYHNRVDRELMWSSLKEGLEFTDYDFVSFQQVSQLSGDYDSYFPELLLLMDAVRKHTKAQFVFHQTWSYAKTFSHVKYGSNPLNQDLMDKDIRSTYLRLSDFLKIPYIMPSGEAIRKARLVFGDELNRDGFHLNERGRTLCGYTLAYYLLGLDIDPSSFVPEGNSYGDGAVVDKKELPKLMEIAKETVLENKGHNLW